MLGRWMDGWVDVSVALLSSSPRAPPGGDRQTDVPFPTTTHTKTPKPQNPQVLPTALLINIAGYLPTAQLGTVRRRRSIFILLWGGGHTNTTIMMPSAISLISLYIHTPDPKQTNNLSR